MPDIHAGSVWIERFADSKEWNASSLALLAMTENMPPHCRGGSDQAPVPDYHG